jgi:heme exporter protein D
MNGGFWHMGGYALYVWSAYGVTAVVLAAELLQLVARRRAALERLRQTRRVDVDRETKR